MTNHAGRFYALAGSILLFFLSWAAVAAHPWATSGTARDPQLVALAQREQRLRKDAGLVQRVVARRYAVYQAHFAAYKAALARRNAQNAAAARQAHLLSMQQSAPAAASAGGVRVVTLPPLVITRTS